MSDDLVVGADAPVGPAEPRIRRPQVVDLASADLWDDLEAASAGGRRRRPAIRRQEGPTADPPPVGWPGGPPGADEPEASDAAAPDLRAAPLVAIPAQNPPVGSTPAQIPTGGRSLSAVEITGPPDDPRDRVPMIVRLSRDSLLPEVAAALVVVLLVVGVALVARSGATRPTAEDAVAAVVRSAEPDAATSPTRKKKVSGPKVSKPPKRVVTQVPVVTEPTRPATTTRTKKTSRPPAPTTTSEQPTEEPTTEQPTEEPTTEPPSDPPSEGG